MNPREDADATVYGLKAANALEYSGRPDLIPHLAAWKEGRDGGWKPTSSSRPLSDVRDAYDGGLVDLVQRRTRYGTALLALPRRVRAYRLPRERFSNLVDFAAASERVKRS